MRVASQNGQNLGGPPPTTSSSCTCCPYGFHLDLDFVAFAEDVASGRDALNRRKSPEFNYNAEPRRSRSTQSYANGRNGVSNGTGARNGDGDSPSAFRSLSKKSLNDVANDIEELRRNYGLLSNGNHDHLNSNGVNGNRYSPTHLPQEPTSKSQRPTTLPYNRHYIPNGNGNVIPPRYQGALSSGALKSGIDSNGNGRLADRNNAYSPFDPYATLTSSVVDHHEYSKTPLTVCANEEVSQIFAERQHTLPAIRKSVTSAPTSPVPGKGFYTALGQTLASLRTRAPLSPILHQEATPFQTGAFTPTTSFTTSTPKRSTDSGALPNFFDSPSSAKPPLPRRYYDSNKRQRVLSPEPEKTRSPSTLRSSNLQNRTYYASATSPRENGNGNIPASAAVRQVAYRKKGGGFEVERGSSRYDQFQSVRRKQSDENPYPYDTLSANYRPLTAPGFQTSTTPLKPESISTPHTVTSTFSTTQTQTPPYHPTRSSSQDASSQTQIPVLAERAAQTNLILRRDASNGADLTNVNKPLYVDTTNSPISFEVDNVDATTDVAGLEPKTHWRQGLSVELQCCMGHESEHLLQELEAKLKANKTFVDVGTFARPEQKEAGTHHQLEVSERITSPINFETPADLEIASVQESVQIHPTPQSAAEVQTDSDWLRQDVQQLFDAEKMERKSVDKKTETDEEESNDFIMITCSKCEQKFVGSEVEHFDNVETNADEHPPEAEPEVLHYLRKTSLMSEEEWEFEELERQIAEEEAEQRTKSPFREIVIQRQVVRSVEDVMKSPQEIHEMEEAEMLANLDQLASLDPDRFSIDTDVQTVIMLDAVNQNAANAVVNENGDHVEVQRSLDPVRTEAIRKLLTEPARPASSFQRESQAYRSYRVEKSKADDLEYVTEKHSLENKAQPSTTPFSDPEKPLKEMVVLKKFGSLPPSLAEPISAKIPRPKFAKYSPQPSDAHPSELENADEAAEAADKLTPLRSELQYFDEWRSSGRYRRAFRNQRFSQPEYPPPPPIDAPDYESDDEATGLDPNDPLSTSSNSSLTSDDGDFDRASSGDEAALKFELSPPLKEALDTLNKHLLNSNEDTMHSTDWAYKYVQHEWLRLSTKKNANADAIEQFIDALEELSSQLMETVINFQDQNGNTALHYAVSHENYGVVSALLDAKVCRVDDTNKAGYSPVMLAALCDIKDETEAAIVQRLFERGNVNAKAVYHGQTALMLAVSHGRIETTNLLLNCGADDIDGSTALMCAAEHGHKELVKILLKRNGIDASLTDCDNQSALSIAMENQHRDIGVLIYAHLNYGQSKGADPQH